VVISSCRRRVIVEQGLRRPIWPESALDC